MIEALPRVFISRFLRADSPFWQLGDDWQIVHQSLVAFSPVPFVLPARFDWVFFYSAQAVHSFFEGLQQPLSPALRWAALGPGTARALQDRGLVADFVGDGVATTLAAEFVARAKGCRVLFPQAQHSRQALEKIIAGEVDSYPLVVYDNQPGMAFEIPYCDYLIFTSPMNAQAYYNRYTQQPGQQVIAIGQPTAEKLLALGIADAATANEPSEASLVELLLSLSGR
jgi:uroporphyrinogen-III synthase